MIMFSCVTRKGTNVDGGIKTVLVVLERMEERAVEREEKSRKLEIEAEERRMKMELEAEERRSEREQRQEERMMSMFAAFMQQMSGGSRHCPRQQVHYQAGPSTHPPPFSDYYYSPAQDNDTPLSSP